ncbi:MAG: HD domain-containing protein [Treponema sp.]|jgi:HD-GYP domain-containing protein (c-di-GMP phosphodiesterase class II)|nr:HD domain-containing protein [Treponema sp.]
MTFNRNEFVAAFVMALDFLESSVRSNVTNHNKRVALIAIRLGARLGLSPEDMFDLYAGAMLHDNGITNPVYNKISGGGASDMERFMSHCIVGEENLKFFPFLKPREGMILYHHEAYDGSGYFGMSGKIIPLLAHIIHFADTVEIMYARGSTRKEVCEKTEEWKGSQFLPDLCEAFDEINSLAFWLSLDNRFINEELNRSVPHYHMEMTLRELAPIARIFSKFVDEKSPFTGRHSRGIAEKSEIMANFYNFDEERKTKLILAAHLHDIGKLAAPNAVLDKASSLTAEEFELVKPHVFYTRRMLEGIKGFEDITEWASNHHEKLDGSGYPYGLAAKDLDFGSRLMACIDIYQALTEERPYRKPLEHAEVARIMGGMANNNSIDRDITASVLEALR